MSIVEAMNRIESETAKLASYKKWHPPVPEPLICPYCEVLFQDRMRVLRMEDGSTRPVVMKASVLFSIHLRAYSYMGFDGMCGWKKEDRIRVMTSANWPGR